MMNLYTQNRNIYPQSVADTKRMINNYVPTFVPNNPNKKKSKKQDEDEEPTEKEELLFLQQQDKNWQYCGLCKKKHPAAFDDCVWIKHSGITQATTNMTTNKTKQQQDQADGKQQAERSEQGANFFLQAFEEDYEYDKDKNGIVCCTQSSVTVNCKRISNRTVHLFKHDHQMIQDSWLVLDNCKTINIVCNPYLVTNIYEVYQQCIITTNATISSTNLKSNPQVEYFPYEQRSMV